MKGAQKHRRKLVVLIQGVGNLTLVALMAFAGYAIYETVKPAQDYEHLCTVVVYQYVAIRDQYLMFQKPRVCL